MNLDGDGTFKVISVDEMFSPGFVLLKCEGALMPLDAEAYAEARRLIADAEGVDLGAISLAGRTLTLNEEDIPVVPPTD